MLSHSDKPIIEVMEDLAEHGVEAGYLVPTQVGLSKSILDAHGSLREFLRAKDIHDFSSQAQGPEEKVVLNVRLVEPERLVPTKMSLYRPITKDGDPRIWIYGLGNYAHAWNLLLFIVAFGDLYVVNASRPEIYESRDRPGSPFSDLLANAAPKLDYIEQELIEKLRGVARLGYVDSMRPGPTGVGMTLETLLGITANSAREPDYFGIEIKASRLSSGTRRQNLRVNLFAQVPDWGKSAYKSGVALLESFGYNDSSTGRLQFYCQLDTKPNSLGHYLRIDAPSGLLRSLKDDKDVVCWGLANLKKQLQLKHNRTMWVGANAKRHPATGLEQFHYVTAKRTHSPLVANFETLIEIDAITFDFTLSLVQGKRGPRARDHGYLFKIHPSNLDLLFPKSEPMTLI